MCDSRPDEWWEAFTERESTPIRDAFDRGRKLWNLKPQDAPILLSWARATIEAEALRASTLDYLKIRRVEHLEIHEISLLKLLKEAHELAGDD